MSALAEALVAAQRSMLAAYSKRFVAAATPDDLDGEEEDFRGDLNAIGLTDKLEQGYLLECLRGLRHMGVTAPAAPAAKAKDADPATDAQWARIRRDCDSRKLTAPDGPLSKPQASEIIEQIAAGTYDPAKWSIPF